MRSLALLAIGFVGAAGACATTAGGDVIGPFTGSIARFAVDGVALPVDNTSARALADDLDGGGRPENQLGMVIGTLHAQQATPSSPDDELVSGAIESTLELQADSFANDGSVGASYFGADDDPVTVVGGTIVSGVFVSNRTRTTHVAGAAIVRLPILRAADPSVLELHGVEVDATPDSSGGYDVLIRGGVTRDSLTLAISTGLPQMFANDPDDPWFLARIFDTNRDGTVSADEAVGNSFLQSELYPDIWYRGEMLTSIGFSVHVIPCDSGACAMGRSASCSDRVRNGAESDIDCGGTCHKCAGGATCSTANDCASNACDGGTCRPPSCNDGVANGMETDVDCGWNCSPCTAGKICFNGADCESNHCSGPSGGFGTCI